MTKKDYQAIAAIFVKYDSDPESDTDAFDAGHTTAVRDIAWQLCEVFKRDNPRFNRERFLAACGIE